jgi:hypothetical protein
LLTEATLGVVVLEWFFYRLRRLGRNKFIRAFINTGGFVIAGFIGMKRGGGWRMSHKFVGFFEVS